VRRELPAAPLLAAIEQHPQIGRLRRGWTDRLRRYAGDAGWAAYQRGRAKGRMTLEAIEDLCDVFGWHPRQVYGDAYDAAALAGRPANFDPWKGVA
jgi:hypothetical protein